VITVPRFIEFMRDIWNIPDADEQKALYYFDCFGQSSNSPKDGNHYTAINFEGFCYMMYSIVENSLVDP
jgi:hypothetical protein